VGGSVLIPNEGYKGVIITRTDFGEFEAYDATCTYEVSQTCKVVNTGILGECKCCKSKYIFTSNASPATGPAAAPLRQYNVSKLSSVTLRVYN